jgi:putative ABC transport system permease protein
MPSAVRRLLRRLANLWRWSSVDRDLRDEVTHHLELAAAEHRRRGLADVEARRLALREFGGERWIEASRDARGAWLLQDLLRDARHAARTFVRAPGFALAVILVMALGVGATTAVYSVTRGVVLNPLPYADPESLYTLLEGNAAGSFRLLSYPTYREVAEDAGPDADVAYIRGDNLVVRADDGTLNLLGAFVSPNFFELMGRGAQAGRTFGGAEQSAPVTVLSARLAARVLGSAGEALGATLSTPDGTFTVVGVMPPGFGYPIWADLWLPVAALPEGSAFALERRDLHVDSDVLVRVRPGASPDQVGARLGAPIARASAAHPEPVGHFDRAVLTPLRDRVVGPAAARLGLLLGGVVLMLVLASVNIAGLVLARGMARRGELAARLALGAGRGRLVRQLMTEATVLGLIGGVLGVLLAYAAVAWLKRSAPTLLPRMEEVSVDGGVLLFAVGITLLSAIVFGAVAAWRATSGVAAEAVRTAGRTTAGDRTTVRVRAGLVVVQIALAVVLLVSASLLVRTGRELTRLDLGFEPAGLITLRVTPPARYGDDVALLQLYEQLRESLERVPGVERVALANHIPLTRAAMPTAVATERVVAADENTLALFRVVSWDYLPTIGASAVHGRLFIEQDARGTGVLVNETLARREWGEAGAVGRPITVFRSAQGVAGFGEPLSSHVVGVVRDIREQSPDQLPAPAVYVPLERNVWPNIHVVLKTAVPAQALAPALRAAVRDVDPDIPTAGPNFSSEFRSLEDYFGFMTQTRRFATALLAAFAAVAVVISLTGLFAMLVFVVMQRTREIGVRMALGARRSDAAALIVRQSVGLVVAGLALGLTVTIPMTSLLEASLFGVERLDVASYAITCLLFLGTAACAVYLPARRAAGVDPVTALRAE